MTGSRFSRHVALPQIAARGQERIARSTALVIGLGGVGCPAALYLATSGIGRLVLNDFDRVDDSNLPRQVLFSAADIGHYKAEVAAHRLATLEPGIGLQVMATRLDDAGLAAAIAAADVVLDASDNFGTRWRINRACLAARKPLVSAAAIRFEVQLAVFRFDQRPGQPCYRCLYAEDDENLESCTGQGILAPVAGAAGTLMASQALLVLAGSAAGLDGRVMALDLLSGLSRTVAISPRADCPACGTAPGTAGR